MHTPRRKVAIGAGDGYPCRGSGLRMLRDVTHALDAAMAPLAPDIPRSPSFATGSYVQQTTLHQASVDRLMLQLPRARSIVNLRQRRHRPPMPRPSQPNARSLPKPRQPAAGLYTGRRPSHLTTPSTCSTPEGDAEYKERE